MTSGARFRVSGSRNGSPVTVSWSPGALDGDPPTVDLVLAELEIAQACTGDGMSDPQLSALLSGSGDPLGDPHVSYALLERVFDTIRDVEGQPTSLVAGLRRRRNPGRKH